MGVYRTQPTRTRIARWFTRWADRWTDVLLYLGALLALAILAVPTWNAITFMFTQP